MKYIIADPDVQTGIELKKILDKYEMLVFRGHFINFEDTENSIYKESPDIAFIRIGKAELNAFKLAEAIRELNPLSKIIFLSSNVEYAVEAFDCGVDGFLFVPLSKEKVSKLLDYIIRKENVVKHEQMDNYMRKD